MEARGTFCSFKNRFKSYINITNNFFIYFVFNFNFIKKKGYFF